MGFVPLLNQDQTMVPLMLRDCNLSQREIDTLVEASVDIYPTVLDLAGIEKPRHLSGKSLLDLKERNYGISESLYGDDYEISIRDKEWCYNFKCNMDKKTGHIFEQDVKSEGLYKRCRSENGTWYERYQNNYIDNRSITNKFKRQYKEYRNKKCYYEEKDYLSTVYGNDYKRFP